MSNSRPKSPTHHAANPVAKPILADEKKRPPLSVDSGSTMSSKIYKTTLEQVLNKPKQIKQNFIQRLEKSLNSVKTLMEIARTYLSPSELTKLNKAYIDIQKQLPKKSDLLTEAMAESLKTAMMTVSTLSQKVVLSLGKTIKENREEAKTDITKLPEYAMIEQEEKKKETQLVMEAAAEGKVFNAAPDDDPVRKISGKLKEKFNAALENKDESKYGSEAQIIEKIELIEKFFKANHASNQLRESDRDLKQVKDDIQEHNKKVADLKNNLTLESLNNFPKKSAKRIKLLVVGDSDTAQPPKLDLNTKMQDKKSLGEKVDQVFDRLNEPKYAFVERSVLINDVPKATNYIADAKKLSKDIQSKLRKNIEKALTLNYINSEINQRNKGGLDKKFRKVRDEGISKDIQALEELLNRYDALMEKRQLLEVNKAPVVDEIQAAQASKEEKVAEPVKEEKEEKLAELVKEEKEEKLAELVKEEKEEKLAELAKEEREEKLAEPVKEGSQAGVILDEEVKIDENYFSPPPEEKHQKSIEKIFPNLAKVFVEYPFVATALTHLLKDKSDSELYQFENKVSFGNQLKQLISEMNDRNIKDTDRNTINKFSDRFVAVFKLINVTDKSDVPFASIYSEIVARHAVKDLAKRIPKEILPDANKDELVKMIVYRVKEMTRAYIASLLKVGYQQQKIKQIVTLKLDDYLGTTPPALMLEELQQFRNNNVINAVAKPILAEKKRPPLSVDVGSTEPEISIKILDESKPLEPEVKVPVLHNNASSAVEVRNNKLSVSKILAPSFVPTVSLTPASHEVKEPSIPKPTAAKFKVPRSSDSFYQKLEEKYEEKESKKQEEKTVPVIVKANPSSLAKKPLIIATKEVDKERDQKSSPLPKSNQAEKAVLNYMANTASYFNQDRSIQDSLRLFHKSKVGSEWYARNKADESKAVKASSIQQTLETFSTPEKIAEIKNVKRIAGLKAAEYKKAYSEVAAKADFNSPILRTKLSQGSQLLADGEYAINLVQLTTGALTFAERREGDDYRISAAKCPKIKTTQKIGNLEIPSLEYLIYADRLIERFLQVKGSHASMYIKPHKNKLLVETMILLCAKHNITPIDESGSGLSQKYKDRKNPDVKAVFDYLNSPEVDKNILAKPKQMNLQALEQLIAELPGKVKNHPSVQPFVRAVKAGKTPSPALFKELLSVTDKFAQEDKLAEHERRGLIGRVFNRKV